MKKFLLGATAALLALSAHAGPAGANAPSRLYPVLGVGITGGGDNLGTVAFTNGDRESLYAGGTVDLRAGLEYELQSLPVELELSLGYHVDRVNASNGDATFRRYPLELIAHFDLNRDWRVGVGARKSLNTQLDTSSLPSGVVRDYDASVGGLVELEYFLSPMVSLKGRYVSEEFTAKDGTKQKVDGSHVGGYLMLHF